MKKIKTYGVIISFILSIILHFIYNIMPNTFISIIAPVNESIWEHMKLIVSSSLIFSVIEYIIYKTNNIPFNNFSLSYSISTLLGVIIYLFIYIPLNDILGHKIYIAIILLFLIFILIQIISYYIMNKKKIKYSLILSILLIVITYFIFYYLTYYPPKINLFYDYLNKQYGIRKFS